MCFELKAEEKLALGCVKFSIENTLKRAFIIFNGIYLSFSAFSLIVINYFNHVFIVIFPAISQNLSYNTNTYPQSADQIMRTYVCIYNTLCIPFVITKPGVLMKKINNYKFLIF